MIRPLATDYLIDLAYPSGCRGCGRRHVLPLCPDCYRRLMRERPAGELSGTVTSRPLAFSSLRAAGDYGGGLKDVILAFKSSEKRLARPLASLMAAAAGNDPAFLGATGVCFVPSPGGRIAERGYNPARVLADRIASILGMPLSDVLRVARETADQDRTPGASRWSNVRGAFAPRPGTRLEGPVLLVDDVITSGATADGCARALLSMGASSVAVLVGARAVLRNHPNVHY